jgi:hypothetical protein
MDNGNVWTQINETAGADLMPDGSKYPQAAAMIQPTSRPPITLADFIIGEPNLSSRIMVRKTTNPSPEDHRVSREPLHLRWTRTNE